MDPIKTTDYQYLISVLYWYAHFRRMDSHKLSLKLANEKAASMWSCDNVNQVLVTAEYIITNIDKLLRGEDHEA